MWLELSVCLNSQGNFWEKTLLFLLHWKRQCGTRHVVCGDKKLAQVTRLLPSVTYLRTYLLRLQQPPVCLTLPGQSCCCSLWVNRDTLSSLFYFVCFIVSRTIYKYIFSIANIVVSEWWPLQPYPYHIGFRDGTKSVLGRKKKIEGNFKFCDLEGCAGCRPATAVGVKWPSPLDQTYTPHCAHVPGGPPSLFTYCPLQVWLYFCSSWPWLFFFLNKIKNK